MRGIDRRAARRRVVLRVEIFLHHRRFDEAGADAVRADALGGTVEGHALGQHHDPCLGGGIAVLTGHADDTCDRGRVQDGPAPGFYEAGPYGPAGPVDARQVEVDDAIPFVGGEGLDGADGRNRRVVDEDVDASQRLPRALRHGGDGGVVSDVGDEADRRSSLGTDRGRVALRAGAVEIGNRDGRALRREALCGRGPNARSSAGHQRAFACQTHRRSLLQLRLTNTVIRSR